MNMKPRLTRALRGWAWSNQVNCVVSGFASDRPAGVSTNTFTGSLPPSTDLMLPCFHFKSLVAEM